MNLSNMSYIRTKYFDNFSNKEKLNYSNTERESLSDLVSIVESPKVLSFGGGGDKTSFLCVVLVPMLDLTL